MGVENQYLQNTTLKLGIDKTIQPKQYEPIKIQISIEETFSWGNEKERESKMQVYKDRMLNDFIKCFNEACVKIGEKDRCIGIISTIKKNSSDNKEWSFD